MEKKIDWMAVWGQWARQGSTVFLESAGPLDEASQWLILAGDPQAEFFEKDGVSWLADEDGGRPVSGDFWNFINGVSRGDWEDSEGISSIAQAWFGVISYEFGKDFHSKKKSAEIRDFSRKTPDYYFFKPRRILAFNRGTQEYFAFGDSLGEMKGAADGIGGPFRVGKITSHMTWEEYEKIVRGAQAYIAAGDIYQANLARSFQADWEGNPGNLYGILREINPGPFMGIFQGRDFTVVSSSPERLAAGRGAWLESRPIAGTRPRGKDSLEDIQRESELRTSPKEQAEHLMLVDLVRSDLGKVARFGTVEVSRYAGVESYAKVHHLVSVVTALKQEKAGAAEVLQALFPGGTVTGCPKIRSMEIIEELEKEPRGFYTGAMGYVGPGSTFDFNILIRTFTLGADGKLDFFAGAGIVADSDPQREYWETLYKVEALAQALGTSLVAVP